jgi:hypothetical protein
MTNPLCKIALFLLAPLLIAGPAAATDLIPYDNGYIPEQYQEGDSYGAYPGYGANGNYGAESSYCDPNGEPLADDPDGSQEPCVPTQPYPAAILPNGPVDAYTYQGQYEGRPPPATIAPNNRYGDYRDQYGRQPSALPNDRYGHYPAESGYRPSPSPPAAPPSGYSDRQGYGTNRRAPYGGYPAQSYDRSVQPNYRPGPTAPPTGMSENFSPYHYGPDRAARYGGYPSQGGYAPAPAAAGDYASQRGYEAGPPPSGPFPPNDPYDRSAY